MDLGGSTHWCDIWWTDLGLAGGSSPRMGPDRRSNASKKFYRFELTAAAPIAESSSPLTAATMPAMKKNKVNTA